MSFKAGDLVYVKYTPGIYYKYIGKIERLSFCGKFALIVEIPNRKNSKPFGAYAGTALKDLTLIGDR